MSAARALGLLLGVAADSALAQPPRDLVTDKGSLLRIPAHGQASQTVMNHPRGKTIHCGRIPLGGLAVVGMAAAFLVERRSQKNPLLQTLSTAAATWAVLGASDLVEKGTALSRSLEKEDFGAVERILTDWGIEPGPRLAPERVGQRAGSRRDAVIDHRVKVINFSQSGIEAIADTTMNSVVSPLLWGALAGIPGLVASRILVAYEKSPPTYQGKRSLGETARFLPARFTSVITELLTPIIGGSTQDARQARKRDVIGHPAPSTASVRATFAGALKVRLGGRTNYASVARATHVAQATPAKELPVLGDGRNPDAGHVLRAVELSRLVGWVAGGSALVLALLARSVRR